ncbi:lipase family protein [Acetonema longum]|uniref:Fungal lipase-type domain-containing protein n=1 Tax=Acetonema longum DSM 6540 TaxID=1009370 RepID=F7NEE9_9FIRM|nr:lipase family protein [Acetonema longum]EGO65360.1 hypothetical protein ALO_02061 [Acetonema longum DSM 6540]
MPQKRRLPPTEPKVHKGFNEFVQAGPSAVLRNPQRIHLSFPDLLRNDRNYKLLLTGHSLGGAAATLSGARLLSMGVSPDQLEIITFGAPAVGNAAFAAHYEPILPLTRIVHSGDKVTGVLQTLAGGYRQFGREILWRPPDMVDDAHELAGYIDSAIKNYYDKRRLAIEAGMPQPVLPGGKYQNHERVYITPLTNNLLSDLSSDFWYMQEALLDEYRQALPDSVIAKDRTNWREAAVAAGCRWAVVSEVGAVKMKEVENTYYIIFTQTVYNITNDSASVAATAVFSTSTSTLTPLGAFIHTFKGMHAQLADQFNKASQGK